MQTSHTYITYTSNIRTEIHTIPTTHTYIHKAHTKLAYIAYIHDVRNAHTYKSYVHSIHT